MTGQALKLQAKTFDELTREELYEIIRVRVAVFVVEQECAYQELDGLDARSLHVYYERGGRVLAYLRAFEKEPGVAQLGRVLTVERGTGLGGKILSEGIRLIRERFDAQSIFIEAQTYAIGYYAREGFEVCSDEFDEHGITHVAMRLEL